MLSLTWSSKCDQLVEPSFVPVERHLGASIGDKSEDELPIQFLWGQPTRTVTESKETVKKCG